MIRVNIAMPERMFRVVLQERERVLGSEHPDTLETRNDLEAALYYEGKYAEAVCNRSCPERHALLPRRIDAWRA
jgi:hypothetical protein